MRFLLFLLVLLPYPILAQSEGDWDELMQQMAEEQMAETGDEQTWEAQQELLTELHENPLDLNNATRQQLMILPFLSQRLWTPSSTTVCGTASCAPWVNCV